MRHPRQGQHSYCRSITLTGGGELCHEINPDDGCLTPQRYQLGRSVVDVTRNPYGGSKALI